MDSLQNALKSSAGRSVAPKATVESVALEAAAPVERPASAPPRKPTVSAGRAGKENIAAWLPAGFKRSIRLVQAKLPGDPALQDVMAEAFNDLFVKYNVPTVSDN
jgi:hypothetical protein